MRTFIPLLRSEWQLLLFGFAMTYASAMGQTFFISLFSGEIRTELGLSHGDFGVLYSAATLCSAVILLWSGTLIDRMDLRHFSYLTVAGLGVGCLLLAVSHNGWMLFIGLLLLRHFGQGLMSMASTTAMMRYLEAHKGKANALSSLGYSVSEAMLPTLVILILSWLGWRQTWVLWTLLLCLSMPLLIHFLLRDQPQRHQRYLYNLAQQERDEAAEDAHSLSTGIPHGKIRRRQWTRAEVIRDPLFYLFLPVIMTLPLLFTGFMFHQVHLVEEKGWSLALWGSLYILYAGAALVMKLVSGLLIDRFGALLMVVTMALPMGLGLLILSMSATPLAAAAFMLLLGISAGIYSTSTAPFFSEKYGNKHLGAIKSLATSVMVFASALAPVVMGWLIDTGITMNSMAQGATLYILLASLLAWLAYRRSVSPPTLSRITPA